MTELPFWKVAVTRVADMGEVVSLDVDGRELIELGL